MIKQWRKQLTEGHTETWLATAIIMWAIFIIGLTIWLTTKKNPAIKYVLAGILLYEILP